MVRERMEAKLRDQAQAEFPVAGPQAPDEAEFLTGGDAGMSLAEAVALLEREALERAQALREVLSRRDSEAAGDEGATHKQPAGAAPAPSAARPVPLEAPQEVASGGSEWEETVDERLFYPVALRAWERDVLVDDAEPAAEEVEVEEEEEEDAYMAEPAPGPSSHTQIVKGVARKKQPGGGPPAGAAEPGRGSGRLPYRFAVDETSLEASFGALGVSGGDPEPAREAEEAVPEAGQMRTVRRVPVRPAKDIYSDDSEDDEVAFLTGETEPAYMRRMAPTVIPKGPAEEPAQQEPGPEEGAAAAAAEAPPKPKDQELLERLTRSSKVVYRDRLSLGIPLPRFNPFLLDARVWTGRVATDASGLHKLDSTTVLDLTDPDLIIRAHRGIERLKPGALAGLRATLVLDEEAVGGQGRRRGDFEGSDWLATERLLLMGSDTVLVRTEAVVSDASAFHHSELANQLLLTPRQLSEEQKLHFHRPRATFFPEPSAAPAAAPAPAEGHVDITVKICHRRLRLSVPLSMPVIGLEAEIASKDEVKDLGDLLGSSFKLLWSPGQASCACLPVWLLPVLST